MNNFIIEDDELIRRTSIRQRYDTVVAIENKLVITKEEFLACYNKWVKGEKRQ